MKTRILSSIFLFIIVIAIGFVPDNNIYILFCLINVFLSSELYRLFNNKIDIFFIFPALMSTIIYLFGFSELSVIAACIYFITPYFINIVRDKTDIELCNSFYFIFFISIMPFILMHRLYLVNKYYLLCIMLLVWIYDSMAYFSGVMLGKHKLLKNISPKKSWEGLLGATISVFLISYIMNIYIDFYSEPFIISAFVVFFAPLGDLSISMIKRAKNVKDTGSLIPGHGGLFDRLDSFIFLIPIIFLSGVFR